MFTYSLLSILVLAFLFWVTLAVLKNHFKADYNQIKGEIRSICEFLRN